MEVMAGRSHLGECVSKRPGGQSKVGQQPQLSVFGFRVSSRDALNTPAHLGLHQRVLQFMEGELTKGSWRKASERGVDMLGAAPHKSAESAVFALCSSAHLIRI